MRSKEITPLSQIVRPTTFISAPRLSDSLGTDITIATETFQYTGSFKFRAAYNVVSNVDAQLIITASSGNFGQAIAYACKLLGKRCIIVMPDTSAEVKVDAVREFGGQVELINIKSISRFERVNQLAQENPGAYMASAYDDPLVIEGNASLAREIANYEKQFDIVIAPVGGGGLISGLIRGFCDAENLCEVVGAEPLLANDAALSLRESRIVENETEPQTIADGARTVSIGIHNWKIIEFGLKKIVEVPEEKILEAMRLLFGLANLKVEATGALAIGAMLTERDCFEGKSVCAVVSGGNVDAAVYARIINPDYS